MPLGSFFFGLLIALYKKKFSIIYLLIGYLYLFSNGIVSQFLWKFIESPWSRKSFEEINTASAIVVLSGGRESILHKDVIYEWRDPDRFLAGINLFKAGKANTLIFTGGKNHTNNLLPNEGIVNKATAIKFGIPSKSILVTSDVNNTYQEASEISRISKENLGNKPIILVTSAFHMSRAKTLFEYKGIKVIPFPVDFNSQNLSINQLIVNPYNLIPNALSLSMSSKVIREILGRYSLIFLNKSENFKKSSNIINFNELKDNDRGISIGKGRDSVNLF